MTEQNEGSRPTRRRAVRKAAAPVQTPGAEAPAVDLSAELAELAAPAPAKKTTRARKVPVKVTDIELPLREDAGDEQPTAEESAPAAKAPAKKAAAKSPRKRASKADAAPEAPAEAAPAEQAAESTAPEVEAAPKRARRSSKKAAAAPEAPAASEAPAQQGSPQATTGSGSPRLATTAVLFQAPDPALAKPKRRRVVAGAGSPDKVREQVEVIELGPVEDPELETPEELEDAELEGTELEGAEPEASDAEEVQDEESSEEDSKEDGEQGSGSSRRRRRRGGRGRRKSSGDSQGEKDESKQDEGKKSGGKKSEDEEPAGEDESTDTDDESAADGSAEEGEEGSSRRRRRRRSRSGRSSGEGEESRSSSSRSDEVTALRGSTRLEAKRQRRREGRDAGRRRQILTEAEFLARRESVERAMVVRESNGRTQIAVLEDGVLAEHYVSRTTQASMVGNVYLGRVQNVLPSMEAAFVDVGKGRNAVLYAGEVNWDAAGLEGQPRRIETALKSGDSVLVQVTKDPIGHKGARLTSQITLAGRYLVFVPGAGMTGISRKLPEKERARLKKLLREIVPENSGVIVRTAAEGASEEELRADIARLTEQWAKIEKKAKTASAPALLQGEADLAIRVVRDIFNDDFASLVVQGKEAWDTISGYVSDLAPDLSSKLSRWTSEKDVFAEHRIDEQIAKAMDRKVWLPSGGSLVIDRTEAMTVIDVNTGKFTGTGGTLEETVTRNNLEAAEEIVRQLRLRDIGGIIVIDFIDMVLESNRDLVLRRLVECLGRDRTKHQVAEVTSLGLVQMTRKRVGQGLLEAFSETCDHCAGRGYIVHDHPVDKGGQPQAEESAEPKKARRSRKAAAAKEPAPHVPVPVLPAERDKVNQTLATIAAAAAHAHEHDAELASAASADAPVEVEAPAEAVETLVTEPLAEVDEGTRDESVEPSEGEPEES